MEVISKFENAEVDVHFYRLAHLDLQHLTDEQLVHHYIEHGKNEGRLHCGPKHLSDLSEDILIIAAHPINLVYLHIIHSISKYFKKTYLIHSIKNWMVDLTQPPFDNINIEIIYTENVGYDFKKHLIGISHIKKNGEVFNRLWLLNDSFIVTNWVNNLLTPYNLYKIYNNDMIGTFFGLIDDGTGIEKQHIQSFLLIVNKEISEYYYEQLINNDYMNIELTTDEDKLKYIYNIEVGLCYELIQSNKYNIDTLYGYKMPIEISNIISTTYTHNVKELLDSPEFMSSKLNQAWWCGPMHDIFKTTYTFTNNFTANIFFNWNLHNNNRFEENLNIYFHLYQPFTRYYNYFYNNKLLINYCKYNDVDKCVLYPIVVTKLPNYCNIGINLNTLSNMNIIGNHFQLISNSDICTCANLVNYIKKYTGDNKFINYLKNQYFFIKKGYTSINELVDSVRDIQQNTQHKKLVYTNNLNSYDTFWDICDNYVENDTDYIYISDIYDKNVCHNFKHIYCNLDSNDDFYKNRIIKFNKQIFDCYDKVLYIDANVKINSKLSTLFDMLDDETDLVLFSHPERSNVGQEIHEVCNAVQNKSKWNVINDDIFSEFKSNYTPFMNNKLYWLNVQLSNTKYDIYNYINNVYEKYKFKRDQIYFAIIQNNYNIKTINIKYKSGQIQQTNINDPNMIIYDGDYGDINGWTEYFTRPFGGSHL